MYAEKNDWLWAIYPAFNEGVFTFTVKNLGKEQFVKVNAEGSSFDTEGTITLAEEGTALEVVSWLNAPCFKVSGKTLYLTINGSADTDVYLATWVGGNNNHGGNKLYFSNFVEVETISISGYESALTEVDATVQLMATVTPDNATSKTVTWSTSNPEVATVDATGLVTAVANGKATITATAGGETATCEVTVAIVVPVTGVALDKTEATLTEVGATVTLVATVSPDNATNKTVTWESSNTEVATVVDGVVTAVANGKATITAKAGEKTATCEVTVAIEEPETPETPEEPETPVTPLSVVRAMVGDVEIVDGAATVESISSFEITFDRPVALAEDAEWAQLTDQWGDNPLKAEVLEENNCVVRFSLQWDVFTDAGDYYLYIPEAVVVDAEDANYANAAIEAVITIEGGSDTPAAVLTVLNVTVGEDVMEGFTVVATTEDMIKVNFDGMFYFQGSPVIVAADGKEAPEAFEYMHGLDLDGSNSYILMGKTEGVYTITLPKASFMVSEYMPMYKAPAEDIVLTVQITLPEGIENIKVDADAVIYDIHGRRVSTMEKGIYIVNGRKVIVK